MGGIPLISRKWRPLLCAHKLLKYPMDLTTPISLATPNQSSLNFSNPNYSIIVMSLYSLYNANISIDRTLVSKSIT